MIKRGKKASPVLIIRATSMRFRGGIKDLLVQLAVQHFGYFAFRPVFMGWFKSAHWYHSIVTSHHFELQNNRLNYIIIEFT